MLSPPKFDSPRIAQTTTATTTQSLDVISPKNQLTSFGQSSTPANQYYHQGSSKQPMTFTQTSELASSNHTSSFSQPLQALQSQRAQATQYISSDQQAQPKYSNRYQEFQQRSMQTQFAESNTQRLNHQNTLSHRSLLQNPFETSPKTSFSHRSTNNQASFHQKSNMQSHFSTTDYQLVSGNKLNLSNSSALLQTSGSNNTNIQCNCSEGSWTLVRDQLRQIKQLSNDHLFASQESKRLREQNEDLLNQTANMASQIAILEQKLLLQGKEFTSKLTASRDKIKQLELFNKDLFSKVSFYEQTLFNYEAEFKLLHEQNQSYIQGIEEEKDYLKQNLDKLHDTMNETILESESKYKSKLDAKNQKIKQLKQQINTDKELIDSYQVELIELQTENKAIKNDLSTIQSGFSNFQSESHDSYHKIQSLESQLQSSFKQNEDIRNKYDEQQQQIAQLLQNNQLEAEEKMKAFQQFNQHQIAELMTESTDLKKLAQEYHGTSLHLQLEIANHHAALNTLIQLISMKGRDNEDFIDTSPTASDNSQSEVFIELRSKLLKLIQSKQSLQKKKKSLSAKVDEMKEQIEELQQTLHQVAAERTNEILYNEQTQIQYQLLQEQNQQLQRIDFYQNPTQQLLIKSPSPNTRNSLASARISVQQNTIQQFQQQNHQDESPQDQQLKEDYLLSQNRVNQLQSEYQALSSLSLSLIYGLSKAVQRLQGQLNSMRSQAALGTAILFSYVESNCAPSTTAVARVKKVMNVVRFLRKLRFRAQDAKQKKQTFTQMTTRIFNVDFRGDANTKLLASVPDFNFDQQLLQQIKNTIGSDEGYIMNNHFHLNQFSQLMKLLSVRINTTSPREFRVIHSQNKYKLVAEIINLNKEMNVVETDNIHLKQMIVELQGQHEEIHHVQEKQQLKTKNSIKVQQVSSSESDLSDEVDHDNQSDQQ